MPLNLLLIGILLDTQENANRIAQAVVVEYESLGKPVLTIKESIEAGWIFDKPGTTVKTVGDPEGIITN